jgi:hypothetical protein
MDSPATPPARLDDAATRAEPPAAASRAAHAARAGGIRFDSSLGCRVILLEGAWRIRLLDPDTGNILFESQNTDAFVDSAVQSILKREAYI